MAREKAGERDLQLNFGSQNIRQKPSSLPKGICMSRSSRARIGGYWLFRMLRHMFGGGGSM